VESLLSTYFLGMIDNGLVNEFVVSSKALCPKLFLNVQHVGSCQNGSIFGEEIALRKNVDMGACMRE